MKNGRIVNFDKNRITNAIFKRVRDKETASELSGEVVSILERRHSGKIPTAKEIHHIVKRVLKERRKEPKPTIRSRPRNFTQALKKRGIIVLLAILVVGSIWIWFLSSASTAQLQAYQQFLNWALLFFFFAFMAGIVVAAPKKKRSVVRIRGEIEVEEGGEVIIRAPLHRPWRVSIKVVKWTLILGCIISLVGFAFGITSSWFGYASASVGGFTLGVGLALFFRSYRRS